MRLLGAFVVLAAMSTTLVMSMPDARPAPTDRKFVSKAIDDLITNMTSRMKDPVLATMFSNCLPNTLDTTVFHVSVDPSGLPDTFVITGDIEAMWLRDSMNQVHAYMPYISQDAKLKNMVLGVLYRQARSINIDSYANAFNYNNTGSPWQNDQRTPPMNTYLWEGKYELDSLCAFFAHSYNYWTYSKDPSPFNHQIWLSAIQKAIHTIKTQQKSSQDDDPPAYSFQRIDREPTDTLSHGRGWPAAYTQMSKSPFRPSDDSHMLPFPIAANAMAVVNLRRVAEILANVSKNASLAAEANTLADQISAGITNFGIVNHPTHGQIYAYEVDGFGNSYTMDDANIPSLLSLPFLGWKTVDDKIYQNTRQFLLSTSNPYYFQGSALSGIGGPHVGLNYVWPMAITMQAQTSNNDKEIIQCLEWLKVSSAGTGFMHESCNKNNPQDFTRPWFAWANSQFGTLILTLAKERPYLIFN